MKPMYGDEPRSEWMEPGAASQVPDAPVAPYRTKVDEDGNWDWVATPLPAAPAPTEDFHIGVSVEPNGTHVQVWDGETKLYEQFHEMPSVAALPAEQADELPITRSTYGSLAACEAEHARRNAALTKQAGGMGFIRAAQNIIARGFQPNGPSDATTIGSLIALFSSTACRAALAARPAPTEAPKEPHDQANAQQWDDQREAIGRALKGPAQ